MTTAHRPTFTPALGGTGKNEGDLSKISKQYSSRDMPSHTKLKQRLPGQGNTEDLKGRDFRRDLEDREKSTTKERHGGRDFQTLSAIASSSDSAAAVAAPSRKQKLGQLSVSNLDADDPVDEDADSDGDEDDTAELLAELERIKKERETERDRQEADRRAEEEQIRLDNILHGNPLLNPSKQDFTVKRRWDDDVVFKNCAKGLDDRQRREPSFINDALRSEFHRKFMEKYIK
ncbi:unnamed protein product [Soboliphyme baturini]|uniref:Spliceosome-associated protein CWC15 homolog n=1 Tax=Soboliphyme baturini TaxID=241478 RepID=A0A183IXD6_9BILA|nr:unnamed protein product [Soboliphyme baturini]